MKVSLLSLNYKINSLHFKESLIILSEDQYIINGDIAFKYNNISATSRHLNVPYMSTSTQNEFSSAITIIVITIIADFKSCITQHCNQHGG